MQPDGIFPCRRMRYPSSQVASRHPGQVSYYDAYVMRLAAGFLFTSVFVCLPVWPQAIPPVWTVPPAPPARAPSLIAVRAGRLFDAKSGTLLRNQVILIRGERITDVGASLEIPAGAQLV